MVQIRKKQKNIFTKIVAFIQKKGFFSSRQTREQGITLFFGLLILILISRLFYLQVVKGNYYSQELSIQHTSNVDISPNRGEIYALDEAGNKITLATNAELYTLYADAKFIWDVERVVEMLTPSLYKHLCVTNGLNTASKEDCIKNIEQFAKITILPKPKTIYYKIDNGTGTEIASSTASGTLNSIITSQQYIDDTEENKQIEQQRQEIINSFSENEALTQIRERLTTMLTPGQKEKNYLGFFESPLLLNALSGNETTKYISIENTYYLYINPELTTDSNKQSAELSSILKAYGYDYEATSLLPLFSRQDKRYVKITEGINAEIAQEIRKLINDNYSIKSSCPKGNPTCDSGGIPLLHAIGLEKEFKRYYPLGSFAANVLGYISPQGTALYGIEQYYDNLLKGTPGQIKGLTAPWIGEVGSNEVSIINPIDGGDIYLTINPFIQKKVENLIDHYVKEFNADSIAVLVMDPFSGNIVASANAPTFNPNTPQKSYELKALTPEDAYIVDDDTRVDIPVYYATGNELKIATYNDRKNPTLEKYVAKNLLGAQVFVDKNIAFPYEPGSIIKPFTVSAGLDNDEISLYDFYDDPKGEVKIDLGDGFAQYIRNADRTHCIGTHTFLHALTYSCNVGLVRIAQQIKKESFYNYMQKFGFGSLTNIELAGESAGSLDSASSAGLARFFNNSFGQGFLATPVQIAAGYSAIVNGGYYVKPRIVEKIYNHTTNEYVTNPVKKGVQILKPETSETMKDALFQVVYGGLTKQFGIQGYTLGGKTGTSQIAFKGVYRSGNGWTNASFVGVITKENLKYVVVIQVRRPRTNQFGEYTAGKIFGDLSKILIEKDLIIK